MDEETKTTPTETPGAAVESDVSPEPEDPATMERFYGPEWKTLLGIEEDKNASTDSGADAAAGDPASGAGDSEAAPSGAGVPGSQDTAVPPTGGDGGTDGAGDAAAGQQPEAVTDELRQLAELGRQWKQAFATDPKGAIAQLLATPVFSDQDKTELFQQVTKAQAAQAVELGTDYEPASDFEKALIPHVEWMRQGETKVAEALQVRDRDIQHTFVETQALAAKLDAVMDFLGINLPKHDTQAIFQHFDKSPEGTLQDAVAKVYREAVLGAAKVEKQKQTPRPDTIRNGSGGVVTPKIIKSMADAWAAAGDELGIQE